MPLSTALQISICAGRISGVETLEEFDELPAAVAVSDERMDIAFGVPVSGGENPVPNSKTLSIAVPAWAEPLQIHGTTGYVSE